MTNIGMSALRLGGIEFGWSFLFQVMNTLLWILIIFAIYTYIKKFNAKRNALENRVAKLEKEVEARKNEL